MWHARRDSNPRPSGSKPDALSPELRAHVCSRICNLEWGGRRESNPRSSGPQPDVLTATLRPPRDRVREVCVFLILKQVVGFDLDAFSSPLRGDFVRLFDVRIIAAPFLPGRVRLVPVRQCSSTSDVARPSALRGAF